MTLSDQFDEQAAEALQLFRNRLHTARDVSEIVAECVDEWDQARGHGARRLHLAKVKVRLALTEWRKRRGMAA